MYPSAASSEYELLPFHRAPFTRAFSDVDVRTATTTTKVPSPDIEPTSSVRSAEEEPQRRHHRILSTFSGWWLLEICAGFLSLACMVAIIVVLLLIHGKPLQSWKSYIQPNTLVSILATATKSALMLPVAECISQFKWLYFQDGPRKLAKIDIFDSASRGPYGALELLWSVKATALTASLGALITLAALAIDPAAQQVISFRSRQADLGSQNAPLPVSQIFDTGRLAQSRENALTVLTSADVALQGSIMVGVYNISLHPPFECNAPTCKWSQFATLGVCSSCKNVTEDTPPRCGPGPFALTREMCNYTTPSNLNLSASYTADAHSVIKTLFNSTAREQSGDQGDGISLDNPPSLVDLATIKLPDYDSPPLPRAEVFECSLRWCAKVYSAATAINGTFTAESPTELDFVNRATWQNFMPGPQGFIAPRNYRVLSLDETANYTGNKSFTVNDDDWALTGVYLQDVFTTGKDNGVSAQLYRSPDLAGTISNVASSLTNAIRTSQNSTIVHGTALGPETYIHVRWPWLVLPVAVVLLANAFLAISIFENARHQTPLWKSSNLALLFHGLGGGQERQPAVATWGEMEETARMMRVLLKDGSLQNANIAGS